MKVYTDYLTKSSDLYTEDYIDLSFRYNDSINDVNQVKLFKASLPSHATVKMIDGKLQIVPSGDIIKSNEPNWLYNVAFKPKTKLKEIALELNLYEVASKRDANFFKLDYSFIDGNNDPVKGELVGRDDMIIYKDLRSVLYSHNITEWSHVFKVVLNLHGDLAKDSYLYGEIYNEAESKMTSYLTGMLTVLSIIVNKDVPESILPEPEYMFPESLDKLDESTKEQLLMIISKVRQAKSLSMRIKLDDYGSSFVVGEGDSCYDLEITRGNIKFTDKDHVTNIEIEPDDVLAVSIDEFLTSNFNDLGIVTTTATIGDDITFINNENPPLVTMNTSGYIRPADMPVATEYDEAYMEYVKAVGQLSIEEEKLITGMTDSLISHLTDGVYRVYMADEETIVVKDPDSGDFIMTIDRVTPFKLKIDTKDSSKSTKTLSVKSCSQIWSYLTEILKQN